MKELIFTLITGGHMPNRLLISCSQSNAKLVIPFDSDSRCPFSKQIYTNEELAGLKRHLMEFMDKTIAAPEETEEQKFERRVMEEVEKRLEARGEKRGWHYQTVGDMRQNL